MELWIGTFFSAIVVLAILYVISIWVYKRAPANMGFIRTGFLGTKVCLGRGAIVLPVFHEVSWISLETIKLIVSRSREQAVLTSDKIRIDICHRGINFMSLESVIASNEIMTSSHAEFDVFFSVAF